MIPSSVWSRSWWTLRICLMIPVDLFLSRCASHDAAL